MSDGSAPDHDQLGDAAPPATVPLMLHSLAEFSWLIMPALDARGATSILEIGSESGRFSVELCRWAARNRASITTLDPVATSLHRELAAEFGLRLIEGRSPDDLPDEAFDAYIIDGDHNYWVVSRELAHAFRERQEPLAILHDVGWPCARRDMYYAPEAIPAQARHPFSYAHGVSPHDTGMVASGWRGNGLFAFAKQEGGARNGVRTAVEDFLNEHPELEFLSLPCIFGLGVVFPRNAPWAERVRALLLPLHEHPLLARLEANRIELLLDKIDEERARLMDPALARARGRTQVLHAIAEERSQLADHGALRRQVAALQREVEELRAELLTLEARSRE
jgi:hypothetical protein